MARGKIKFPWPWLRNPFGILSGGDPSFGSYGEGLTFDSRVFNMGGPTFNSLGLGYPGSIIGYSTGFPGYLIISGLLKPHITITIGEEIRRNHTQITTGKHVQISGNLPN